MPSDVSPQWQEKANEFFQSSGVKLKEAGHSAGIFVEEVAKDAKENVSDVAEKVGSAVKSRWAIFQQPSTRHAMQEHLFSAAATTSMFLRRGFSETKDKVAVGKIKVEEVAKKTAEKSKIILTDLERWQKGVASTDVFGVPIELAVQRQQSGMLIPSILIKCADFLILSGLNSPELFKAQGDKKVLRQLVSLYNQDPNASPPEVVSSVDIAALIKCYIASLPEPLTTFALYNDIKSARISIHLMRNILKKLPTVNYMTLELVTALLLRVSQKSPLNKMDARSLAMEMAPLIMWQDGLRPEHYKQIWSQPSKLDFMGSNVDSSSNYSAWDVHAVGDETQDASSSISLDDGAQVDFRAIEVVQCLIERHNAVFTDANETVWRMDREENGLIGDDSHPNLPFSDAGEGSVFFLDHVGEVILTYTGHGLSWTSLNSLRNNEESKVSCPGLEIVSNTRTKVSFVDVYAVDFINWGLVHGSVVSSGEGSLLDHSSEMYRFTVHFVHKAKTQSLWTPSVYTFGHNDPDICKSWVDQIRAYLNVEAERPKSLMVFVHPRSGKGQGCRIWEAVAPLFSQAKVKTKVIVTERVGHARDVLSSITDRDLSLYDGVVAVGGDGFFNELLNGLLLSRHKAPYPPAPSDTMQPVQSVSTHSVERTILEEHCDHHNQDDSPLLTGSEHVGPNSPNREQDPEFSFPNEMFRFGIIPAGSTDAIVICTTGVRDPMTSALHIILGKRVGLDIAQVVRWKETHGSNEEPCVRYAASFAGYGFYGDVITESEKYRWMGPKRYDYAGTKVFLQHRSYEAEVNYLEVESDNGSSSPGIDPQVSSTKLWRLPKKPNRVSCRANCAVCNSKSNEPSGLAQNLGLRWSRSKGRFLSVGAAVISCRNEKAPDGLVADAHLSDGFLHLILIKDCPHPFYLCHLIQLARRGGDPLDFKFVEHHKTPAFTFTSFGKEGIWNVDGEAFPAHKLSAKVFRGLVSLFATGPSD